ncbi:MAG: hypothetical protein K0U47_10275 [Epsilonproteobacteria bacterium]|nr:hypothetical protein [Campylobacterota bacterium]
MVFAIKKQFKDFQSWVNIASENHQNITQAISRYDFVTFIFVFTASLFITFVIYEININFVFAALIIHFFLGINLLKARTIVANSLTKLEDHKEIEPNVAQFLNKEYSLFLVTQGKLPLTDDQIENLEVHKKSFINNQVTRAGRGDSIRRFRLAFLKREKTFYNILFGVMIIVEFFVVF